MRSVINAIAVRQLGRLQDVEDRNRYFQCFSKILRLAWDINVKVSIRSEFINTHGISFYFPKDMNKIATDDSLNNHEVISLCSQKAGLSMDISK